MSRDHIAHVGPAHSVVAEGGFLYAADCGSRNPAPDACCAGSAINDRRPQVERSPRASTTGLGKGSERPRWGEPLPVACWCQRCVVLVPHADVLAGRTASCPDVRCQPGCGPNPATHGRLRRNGGRSSRRVAFPTPVG